MSRALLTAAIPLIVGVVLCGGRPDAAEPQAQPAAQPAPANAEERIRQVLEKRVTLEVIEEPLADVLELLSKQAGVKIYVDRKALKDVGVGTDTPVTRQLTDMPFKTVLQIVVKDLDLTLEIRDEVLVITTPEVVNTRLTTKVFAVADLVERDLRRDDPDLPPEDFQSLIDLITSTIEPTTWDDVGGPGRIEGFHGALVISQTRDVLDKVETLLADQRRRRNLWKQWDGKTPVPELIGGPCFPVSEDEEQLRVLRALKEQTEWRRPQASLEQLAAELGKRHRIPVVLDYRALRDAGLASNAAVGNSVEGVTLATALGRLLRPHHLVFDLQHNALMITTPEEAKLLLRTYPVFDLVEESFGEPITTVPFVGSPIPVVGSVESPSGPSLPAQPRVLMQIGGPLGTGGSRPPQAPPRSALGDAIVTNADEVIHVITSAIEAAQWEDVGGPWSISLDPTSRFLFIRASYDGHVQIERMLATLRQITPVPRKMSQELLDEYERQVITICFLTAVATPERPLPSAQELAEVIRTSISPDIWKQPGHSILAVSSRLRVVAPRKTQQAIDRLLRDLNVLQPPPPPQRLPGGGLGGGGFAF